MVTIIVLQYLYMNSIGRESFVFFFFSSRRRHTRCSRDWSSDVCSSDLFMSVIPFSRFAIVRYMEGGRSLSIFIGGMGGFGVPALIRAMISSYFWLGRMRMRVIIPCMPALQLGGRP